MSRMRAEPCAPEVLIGNCQPCHERALIPSACSVIASSPAVTCSPEATTASYSRASCSGEASRHHSTSRLVVPAMADTTTATSWPASTSRLTWRATLRMRSMSATEVPPNFITRRAIELRPPFLFNLPRRICRSRGAKWRVYIPARGCRRNGGAPPQAAKNTRKSMAQSMDADTIRADATGDGAEVARLSRLAGQWCDPHGKMAVLHRFNPVRLRYIRDAACRRFDRDPRRLGCLAGLRILDIGCGGGILCEPLARLGAAVVGVDPAPANVAAAQVHAEMSGLAIDYRAATAEALADARERFDVVLAMEEVEHVADVSLFVRRCAEMVKPSGLMIAATIKIGRASCRERV